MALSTIWWLLAGLAVIAEMLTGTLYLLMVAIGLAAAGVAAYLGVGETLQMLLAAAISAGTVLACYSRQKRRDGQSNTQRNRNLHLDIGEHLQVEQWNADRTAQVRYRGAQWTAVLQANHALRGGTYRVVQLDGNRLLVEPVAEPAG